MFGLLLIKIAASLFTTEWPSLTHTSPQDSVKPLSDTMHSTSMCIYGPLVFGDSGLTHVFQVVPLTLPLLANCLESSRMR